MLDNAKSKAVDLLGLRVQEQTHRMSLTEVRNLASLQTHRLELDCEVNG